MLRAIVASLAVACLTIPASADPVALAWRAPASCPDAGEMIARIERRLGPSLEAPLQQIEIEVSRDNGAFVARVDLRRLHMLAAADQIRVLRSTGCDELADAIAVVVARIATEARQNAPRPRRDHEEVAVADPAPDAVGNPVLFSPALRDRPAAADHRRVASGRGIGAHLLGVSGIGALPSVAVGGELGGYLRWQHGYVEAAYARWATEPAFLRPGAPARVDVRLGVGVLRAGWAPAPLPLRIWLGTEVGTMTGSGMGLSDARSGGGRWAAITSGVSVGWEFTSQVRLIGMLEIAIPVARPSFELVDGTVVYQPATAVRSGLGIEVGWR